MIKWRAFSSRFMTDSRPPSLATPSEWFSRPRSAFSTASGCSKISLSMKWGWHPLSIASGPAPKLCASRLTARLSRVLISKRPGCRRATSLSSKNTTWSVYCASADASEAASAPGHHDFLGPLGVDHRQAVSALHFLQRLQDRRLQIAAVRAFDKVSQHFRVRLAKECVAFSRQALLQPLVIFNDAIVNQKNLSRAIGMRVGVAFRGFAMRRPTGVGDAYQAIGQIPLHHDFELGNLAHGLGEIRRGVEDGDPTRVIPAIFQPL